MCECVQHDDGSMHLCAACAPAWVDHEGKAKAMGDSLSAALDVARYLVGLAWSPWAPVGLDGAVVGKALALCNGDPCLEVQVAIDWPPQAFSKAWCHIDRVNRVATIQAAQGISDEIRSGHHTYVMISPKNCVVDVAAVDEWLRSAQGQMTLGHICDGGDGALEARELLEDKLLQLSRDTRNTFLMRWIMAPCSTAAPSMCP